MHKLYNYFFSNTMELCNFYIYFVHTTFCGVLFDVFINLYLVCYHKELQLNLIVQWQ